MMGTKNGFSNHHKSQNRTTMVAEHLLAIGAVQLDARAVFTLTSGKKSPLYIDVRRLLSHPQERDEIMEQASFFLKENLKTDISSLTIAGGETAGVPFAAFLAHIWQRPMIYVRKEAKQVGLRQTIEGQLKPQTNVLLVEDIMTQGTSKERFIHFLREAGAIVRDIFVPISYQGAETSRHFEKTMAVRIHSLTTVSVLLDVAEEKKAFPAKDILAGRHFLTEM